MRYLVLTLMVVLIVAAIASLALATTEGEASDVVDVTGLQPFTAEANYMSLQGYLRWQTFEAETVWLTPLEAVQAVKAQGCDPTLACRDAMVLNGCREPL